MEGKVKELVSEVETASIASPDEAEQFRMKYLGKKGILADSLKSSKHWLLSNGK